VMWLFTKAKIVAEPSGAATVAAALSGRVSSDGPVVAIVSGGNISLDRLEELRRTAQATA
jgi:threonine dehydratase